MQQNLEKKISKQINQELVEKISTLQNQIEAFRITLDNQQKLLDKTY